MKKLFLTMAVIAISFGVVYSQSITVISPNGGENWKLGSTHNVTWTSSGVSGNVGIKLFQDGTSLGYIAQNVPNSGTYKWTIDNIIGKGKIVAGAQYQIQVKQSGVAGDLSNGMFIISKKELLNIAFQNNNKFKKRTDLNLINQMILPIKIIKPDGGNWNEGSPYEIKWERKNVGSKGVDIFLVDYNGINTIKVIGKNIKQYDSLIWTVPKNTYKFPGNYRIKIVRVDGKAKGLSNPFHISIVTEVKKYKIYATTSNKSHWKNKKKETPISSAPFLVEYKFDDPGNGKLRVGYANAYKKSYGAYNYYGTVYRAHAFFDVSKFKGKGLITKAALHFHHYKGGSCGVKAYYVINASNSLFNIDTELINNTQAISALTVTKWATYPNSNHGILFTGTNESYSHNNSKCVDYYDDVYLEIEIIEKSK